MRPELLSKYARVLIYALKLARSGGKFKKGDNILIGYDIPALPLAEEIYGLLVKEGYNVFPKAYLSEKMSRDFFTFANDAQLTLLPEWDAVFNENLNGMVALRAPQDLKNLKNADAKKIGKAAATKKKLREILDAREQKGLFSWTLANYPTQGLAKQAGLSFREYERQIAKACFLNEKDPVKKFGEVCSAIEEVCKRLSSLPIVKLRMQSKDTDLEISLGKNRKFLGGRGCNVPSFEIFTSPDYRGTNGVYYSDLTSFRNGNYVKNIKLEFKNGRVVKSKAEQGEKFLKEMLAIDAGASQIGEYSLTDVRFSKIDCFMADTLFDENFGGKYGNSHIALGSSYAESFAGKVSKLNRGLKKELGFNESALHWDLVNTQDKLITARLKSGQKLTIYEKGRFVV
jgi:aminopeptidase